MTGDRTLPRTVFGIAAILWIVGLLSAACGRAPGDRVSTDLRVQVADLQRTNAILQRQVELAGGKEFYLVLDPAASVLRLMLRGAELQHFRVDGLQVGRPRRAWVVRRDPRPWQGVIWSSGELDPPRELDRLVIQARPPGAGESDPPPPSIPPTAEELYPVPGRYHVRFDGGFSVEIRPREADVHAGRLARLGLWASAKVHDTVAVLGAGRDEVRLRLVLAPKDADSLYRSLPPGVRMIVLEGQAGAPGSGT